jgi:hypothetical protein
MLGYHLVAAARDWKFDNLSVPRPRDCNMLKTTEPQRKKPSRKAVLRSVASSTAVETRRSVAQLEQQLKQPPVRFAHIKLAR